MQLTQSWVGYLDRSYQQIKQSVLARLVITNPEITDHNESNLLIIIISMFAGIAEMLNYYIDMMGREGFLGTAQRFTSVIQLAQLIDYNARANISATVNLLFSLVDGSGNPYYTLTTITIPAGTEVQDNNGISFYTLQEVQIVPGQAGAYSTASNYSNVLGDTSLGNTNGTALQQIMLNASYVDGTLSITVGGVPWQLYTSAGLMTANTQGFIVAVLADGNCYMIFGDGVNGAIPQTGLAIVANYQTCDGANANDSPNTITNLQSTFTLPAGISMNVTNPDYASGGSNFEDIDDVRNHAPRSIRTLMRAVTYQDYIDVAILCPGVGDADVSYCCGKYVSVYIIPSTQGTATPALVAAVQNWFITRKMITTQVTVIAAGISQLYITATIYANPLYTQTQVLIAVIGLLYSKYAYGNASINGQPSVSSILSLMESDPSVDYVDIVSVQVLPNVQPINGNTLPLAITFTNLPTTNTQYTYTILYKQAAGLFYIYRGAQPMGSVSVNELYQDSVLSFTIASANYTDGLYWQFIAVPSYPQIFPSTIINITDFSVPIINIGPVVNASVPQTIYGNLTVVTQGTAATPNPCTGM